MKPIYVCPKSKQALTECEVGLITSDGICYPFVRSENDNKIPNFIAPFEGGADVKHSMNMYAQKDSPVNYRNFLDWLFQTFDEKEDHFRARLIERLKVQRGHRVLVTGCGLGDDIPPLANAVGLSGEVYASDLAAEMVLAASSMLGASWQGKARVHFSICNASALPFADNFFDGAFHFGGINLFDDIELSIAEMERVVRPRGRVVFGDEGMAPWLRTTEYAQIAINNNSLWAALAPIELLPRNAMDVHLTWVLGNCFYLIDFEVSETGPIMNIDIPHKGRRGGTMRTRYFGKLEGVTKEAKEFVLQDAAKRGISVHEWLEQVIRERQRVSDN